MTAVPENSVKQPAFWIFLPGLLPSIFVVATGALAIDQMSPARRLLYALLCVVLNPCFLGLLSRILRWRVTFLLAGAVVAFPWPLLVAATVVSLRSVYGIMAIVFLVHSPRSF